MTNQMIDEYGTKYWGNAEGLLHREGGPAVECPSGTKLWYINGWLHREDGPAVERDDGSKSWYLNGKQFTEGEFNVRKSIQKPSRAY